jgi:DNA modification methylase
VTEIRPGLDLLVADCLDALAEVEDASVDAVVCDPPYELNFMGRAWDNAGVAFRVETWEAVARVLKPGGHLLAFGGTRTYHRMTVAIEDAGFEVRDCLAWMYGSGFPKSLDVSKAIDARGGYPQLAREIGEALKAARERRGWTSRQADETFCDGTSNWSWFEGRLRGQRAPTEATFMKIAAAWPELAELAAKVAAAERAVIGQGNSGIAEAFGDGEWNRDYTGEPYDITAPETAAARAWQGWGTALKPAFEPIVLARKPLEGTVAANVLEYGTGGLHIDACRIATDDALGGGAETGTTAAQKGNDGWTRPWMDDDDAREAHAARVRDNVVKAQELGRWPANVLLGHSPDCIPVGLREVASDGHFPTARPGGVEIGTVGHAGQDGLEERYMHGETVEVWECVPGCPVRILDEQTGDVGAAAPVRGTEPSSPTGLVYGGERRRVSGAFHADHGGASRFFYCAKVSSAERDAGLDGFDVGPRPLGISQWEGQTNGSGERMGASAEQRNIHPTVKPIALMRWLIRLVTPPGGLVLDPFAGSGTTGAACALEGVRFLGIERDPEYAAIAEARIRFWAEHGEDALRVMRDRKAAELARAEVTASGQLDLFTVRDRVA